MITLNIPIPRLSLIAIGVLLGLSVCLAPTVQQVDNLISEQRADYGQALANSAARESVEAAFRQDLISLRVIAQAVANNPHVARATIHNVEGKILVQAETEKHLDQRQLYSYQATVALQDSVAGVVTVSIKSSAWKEPLAGWFYKILILLCLGTIAWQTYTQRVFAFHGLALFKQRGHATTQRSNDDLSGESNDEEFDENEREDTANINLGLSELTDGALADDEYNKDNKITENSDLPDTADNTPTGNAYAALCVKNVATLQQQLNGEVFRKTFTSLEAKLNHIAELYGGQDCHWENDRYLIRFNASQQEDALFHAACAASLMLDCAGITNRIPLDLSAQVSTEKNAALDDKLVFVGLALHQSGEVFDRVSEKVTLLELEDGQQERKIITEFTPPYNELLKNQLTQINTQFEQDGIH